MAILKKSKKALKNHIGSVSGDLNSAFSKLKSKFGSVGNFSNTFDQRISDGLSDLLTGATGIRTSNIPEISADVLATKNKNRDARQEVLNNKAGRPENHPGTKVKLTFPEKFIQEDGRMKDNENGGMTNYIHFRSLPLRNGSNNQAGAEAGSDIGDLYDIFLYVPEEMTDTTNLTYKAAEKGMLESIMAKLFTFGEGTDQGIMDQIGQKTKEVFTGDIGKAATGRVVNPMKFNMFEGVDFRKFTYNFVLYPKNDKEASVIQEMAYAFKKASLPGIAPNTAGRVYTFPSEWAIRYHGPIKKWIDFPMVSVLESVEVNQSVAGSVRYIDGAPVATEIKLSFLEILTLDKVKYDERVSAFINADNENRETTQEGGTIDDIMGRRPTDVNFQNRWKDRVGMDAQNRAKENVDGEFNFNPLD